MKFLPYLLILGVLLAGCATSRGPERDLVAEPDDNVEGARIPPDLTGEELDIDELLALAEEWSPKLAAAKDAEAAARGRRREAALYPNPSITAREGDVPSDDFNEGGRSTVTLEQPVIIGKRRRAAIRAAEQDRELREILIEKTRHDVYMQVHLQYVEIVYLNDMLSLQWKMIADAAETADLVEARRDAGTASDADARRARYDADELQQDALTLVTQRTTAAEYLSGYLGEIHISSTQITGNLERQANYEEMAFSTDNVVQNHPMVMAAEKRIDINRSGLDLARAERVPDLKFLAGGGYNDWTNETFVEAGVGIEIPVFDRNQGRIEESKALVRQSENEARNARAQLRGEIEALVQLINELDTLASDYTSIFEPAANQAFQETVRAYEAGNADVSDLLDAQRTWFDARRKVYTYRRLLNRRLAELRHIRLYAGDAEYD